MNRRIPMTPCYEAKTGRKLIGSMQSLYDAMCDSGLTYAQVGERSGVSDSTIGKWFCNGIVPSLVMYEAVAGALDKEVSLRRKAA